MIPETPEPESLREALRLNDAHIAGLTHFDQQLVYVPLVALAGLVSAIATRSPVPSVNPLAPVLLFTLVAAMVAFGLRRNHRRHLDLLDHKNCLLWALHLPIEGRRDPLVNGRYVYLGLFMIGMTLTALALAAVLR
jgi:hypothetical protein